MKKKCSLSKERNQLLLLIDQIVSFEFQNNPILFFQMLLEYKPTTHGYLLSITINLASKYKKLSKPSYAKGKDGFKSVIL